MKRCVAIQHVAFENLGVFVQPLEEAGFAISYVQAGVVPMEPELWKDADLAVVLGGPVGVLLGYSLGSLMGSLADLEHHEHDEVVLTAISKSIPRSATALLVEADESTTAELDAFFAAQHATLQRWDYEEVESEVESAVAAYENAASEVKKTIQAEKKHERQAARKQKWDEFKAKFLMQRSD